MPEETNGTGLKRLRERLKGSTSWEEFESASLARKILGGLGNIDETSMPRESGGVEGFSLRLYDPKSRQWSIYWADSIHVELQIPMVGGFEDGRGEFYSQEIFEGRHVYCRFIWSKITANSAQWEQACSEDGGKTWETNWIMEFERV